PPPPLSRGWMPSSVTSWRERCHPQPRRRGCWTPSAAPSSAGLAPGVDRLGRLGLAQDRAGLGHALAADTGGAILPHPLPPRSAAGEQAELRAGFGTRFGPVRHRRLAHDLSIAVGCDN